MAKTSKTIGESLYSLPIGGRTRLRRGAASLLAASVLCFAVAPSMAWGQSGSWTRGANTDLWGNSGNWSGGAIAGGADSTATFDQPNLAFANFIVNLNGDRTVGHLIFNDRDNSDNVNAHWTLTSNILTLQTTTGTPTITLWGTGSSSINWQKDARISSVLAGNQGFTFDYVPDGAAITPRFELFGNNSYTGITDITGGIIQVGTSANALGASGTLANRTIIRSGARLHMEGLTYAAEIIQLDGGTLSDPVNHSPTLTGLVYLTAASTINKQGSGTMTFNPSSGNAIELDTHALTFTGNTAGTVVAFNVQGAITGTGSITNSNTGVLSLAGQNTYTGGTSINAGLVRVVAAENAGVSGPLGKSGTIIFGGGALQYSATNQFDYSSRFSTAANQLYYVDLAGQDVTWASNLSSSGTSGLRVLGAGAPTTMPGSLTLTGTNSFGTGGIIVGNNPSPSGDLNGVLEVAAGSTSTTGVLTVGNGANARGVLRVTGGSLTAASAAIGHVGNNTGAKGVFRQLGGQVVITGASSSSNGLPLFSIAGGTFQYGTLSLNAVGGSIGVFDVSGGAVSGGQANIASDNARAGMLTVRGGSFTATGMTLGSGNNNTYGTLVVSETGTVDLGTANLNLGGGFHGTNTTNGFGTANLVGGVVKAGGIVKTSVPAAAANLTFSGGTLQATKDSPTFLQGLTRANIYVGGATIDTQGFNVNIAQPLLGNTGNGLLTIPIVNGGSNYLAPPTLTITGGGGTGATAVANLDQNGSVESITITNPGSGYTGPISVTISGPTDGSGLVLDDANATFGDNTTGGLTKLGSGMLTLSGVNTYTGVTDVQDGTLALAASGSINNSSGIDVAAGGEFNSTALPTFTMLATQPFTFELDPTGAGFAGLLDASALDIANGVVEFDFVGTLDDPFYVFANYTSLIGSSFASVVTPAGYAIDYNYLGGNQIALVQQSDPVAIPEPGSLLLWGSAVAAVGVVLWRRRRSFAK